MGDEPVPVVIWLDMEDDARAAGELAATLAAPAPAFGAA
jgi:hypothetical protein